MRNGPSPAFAHQPTAIHDEHPDQTTRRDQVHATGQTAAISSAMGTHYLTGPQVVGLQRAAGNAALQQLLSANWVTIQRTKRRRPQSRESSPPPKRARREAAPKDASSAANDTAMTDAPTPVSRPITLITDNSHPAADDAAMEDSDTTSATTTTSSSTTTSTTTTAADDSAPVERLERESTLGFWIGASVRPATDAEVDISNITVEEVSISPARRPTAYGIDNKGKQGAHVVAWSAMVRSWNAQLRGDLPRVARTLQGWIAQDDVADTKGKPAYELAAAKRARAIQALDTILQGPDPLSPAQMTLDSVFNNLELAISLFIESNQLSGIATSGASTGARDEPGGHLTLTTFNDHLPASTLKALGPIRDAALKLLDEPSKNAFEDHRKARIVNTWFNMLKANYPNLAPILPDALNNHRLWGSSVETWLQAWNTHCTAKEAASSLLGLRRRGTKAGPTTTDEQASRGIQVNLRIGDEILLLTAEDVTIHALDIPDKLRAPTKHGTQQQSHTLAWTYLRRSLEKRFEKISARKALSALRDLAVRDQASLNLRGGAETKARSEQLVADIDEAIAAGAMQLPTWTRVLNQLIFTFITVNQRLPLSTYSGAHKAEGHGEPASNKALELRPEKPLSLTQLARYLDLGIFYEPLVRDAGYIGPGTTQLEFPDKEEPAIEPSFADWATAADFDQKATPEQKQQVDDWLQKCFSASRFLPSLKREAGKFDLAALNYALKLVDNMRDISEDSETVTIEDKVVEVAIRNPLQRHADIAGVLQLRKGTNLETSLIHTERQQYLATLLSHPDMYARNLYQRNRFMVNKIIGDFFHHLEYFHPPSHVSLTGEEHKEDRAKLLEIALLAPLDEKDERVGKPIRNSIHGELRRQPKYGIFMTQFNLAIRVLATENADVAFGISKANNAQPSSSTSSVTRSSGMST